MIGPRRPYDTSSSFGVFSHVCRGVSTYNQALVFDLKDAMIKAFLSWNALAFFSHMGAELKLLMMCQLFKME